MAYVIAIAGKGGVGKTTISALLIRRLLEIDAPVLAIDADPNANLNVALGLEYGDTISDIREEAKKSSLASFSKSDLFNMRLQEIIIEEEGVDLLVMGRPEGPGCYCAINNILREYLSRLGKNYKFIVIDNEAGMEHLSRRTADKIDKLLLVSDTTVVGIRSAINAFQTAKKAGLKVKSAALIINKSKGIIEKKSQELINNSGLSVECHIPFQEEIQKRSETGEKMPKKMDLELKETIWKG
ncbi:AAA family ATPase [Candidatus Omnitrophota bacterium]